MQDVAGVIVACAGFLTPVGGAFAWLYNNISKKFDAINEKLDDCEKRDSDKRDALSAAAMGIILLSDENPKLARVGAILRSSIPIESEIPASLKGLLAQIEGKQ